MGAPYSQDLRMRVLAALDRGMSKTKVHQQFKVSRSTVDDWLKLRVETGKAEAKSDYQRGPAPALADSSELRDFIEQHQHNTLGQLAGAWFAAQGQRLSTVKFSKALKRLCYTRKKEPSLPRTFASSTAGIRAGTELTNSRTVRVRQ